MKLYEFYRKYANTPLPKRQIPYGFGEYGRMTLNQLYKLLHDADDQKKWEPRHEELLQKAEDLLNI